MGRINKVVSQFPTWGKILNNRKKLPQKTDIDIGNFDIKNIYVLSVQMKIVIYCI